MDKEPVNNIDWEKFRYMEFKKQVEYLLEKGYFWNWTDQEQAKRNVEIIRVIRQLTWRSMEECADFMTWRPVQELKKPDLLRKYVMWIKDDVNDKIKIIKEVLPEDEKKIYESPEISTEVPSGNWEALIDELDDAMISNTQENQTVDEDEEVSFSDSVIEEKAITETENIIQEIEEPLWEIIDSPDKIPWVGIMDQSHTWETQKANEVQIEISEKIGNDANLELKKYTFIWKVSDWLRRVSDWNKWWFIDENNIEIAPLIYDEADDYHNCFAIVFKDWEWNWYWYTNIFWEESTKCKYADALPYEEWMWWVKLWKKWWFVNEDGKEVIRCIYDDVEPFNNWEAEVKIGRESFVINKRWMKLS